MISKKLSLVISLVIILSAYNLPFSKQSTLGYSTGLVNESVLVLTDLNLQPDEKLNISKGLSPPIPVKVGVLLLALIAINRLSIKNISIKHFLLAVFYQSSYFRKQIVSSSIIN